MALMQNYIPPTEEEKELARQAREKYLSETMRITLTQKFADGHEEPTGFYITRQQAIELVQFSGIAAEVGELKSAHFREHMRF